MTAESSLSQSMDDAVGHYSSLFNLPSYKKVVSLLVLTCLSGGLLSTIILFPVLDGLTILEGLIRGLFLGVSLFCATLILDYAVSVLVLRRDPIYDLRRTNALSLYCWVMWLFFIFAGFVVAVPFGFRWQIRLFLLGFSAVLILRLTVFGATSSLSYKRLLAASILQPLSCMVFFLMFWSRIEYSLFLFILFSLTVGMISSSFFLSLLSSVGNRMLGVPALSLFKAFLLNWVVDLNAPFEELLEKLGEEQDVEVSLIKFASSKPKAVAVVPSVHPGPFKNVGSSLLPSVLKTALEKALNCVVCVPHGLLGHEFDLASQVQNQKIIHRTVESANFETSEGKASPFIKVSNGFGTACCQIFGKSAFLSFTLAPKTTEDLPQELGLFVRQEAEKRRLACCVVVNTHNSIDGKVSMPEVLGALKTTATDCLEKAVSLGQSAFEVGATTIIPKEFSLRDGMGSGGITVFVVKVGDQKTAYVVIDGNNMVSGLRERVLSSLQSVGISEGEVFTTDTHSVNAIILSRRGYHPVGEAMNHEHLIEYIKEAALAALSDLERVKAGYCSVKVPSVRVIGSKQLETLCLLIDRTLQRARKVVVPIFAVSGLVLMSVLMFF